MKPLQKLNHALLRTLMSKESADIIGERLADLEDENEKLRAQNKKLRGALSINSNFWNKSESTADGAALVESMRKVCAHALENRKDDTDGRSP